MITVSSRKAVVLLFALVSILMPSSVGAGSLQPARAALIHAVYFLPSQMGVGENVTVVVLIMNHEQSAVFFVEIQLDGRPLGASQEKALDLLVLDQFSINIALDGLKPGTYELDVILFSKQAGNKRLEDVWRSQKLTVVAIQSNLVLVANSWHVKERKMLTLRATLTDWQSRALMGQTIRFFAGSRELGLNSTNVLGIAILVFRVDLQPGIYKFTSLFSGSDTHKNSSSIIRVVVEGEINGSSSQEERTTEGKGVESIVQEGRGALLQSPISPITLALPLIAITILVTYMWVAKSVFSKYQSKK